MIHKIEIADFSSNVVAVADDKPDAYNITHNRKLF
jgi:hypothetical protein